MFSGLIPSKLWLYGAVIAAIMLSAVWLRLDAVSDFKDKLKADTVESIQTGRGIENETRTDTDSQLFDCVLNRKC